MIACLGETTGVQALENILKVMKNNEEGMQILCDKPRINSIDIDLIKLSQLPNTTFGYYYSKFLNDNVILIIYNYAIHNFIL